MKSRTLLALRLVCMLCLACLAIAAVAPAAHAADGPYYRLQDFDRVDKIDAHVHVHGVADRFMARAIQDHFRVLTINVDYPDFPPLAQQQRDAISLRQRYPGQVAFAASFGVEDFNSPGWAQRTLDQISQARQQGAVGVKIWKNIGMTLKDAEGHYVMPDDERLRPVINALERDHVVLLGHQAEPLNCWLPLDRMTVRSDREYFQAHPQYYMNQHPELPSHDAILAARDRMLSSHPALVFDAVHLASLEWDVDKVAAFLDRYPHARVDLAARLVHLEYQATTAPAKVRRFLLRYQDRILYGSDINYGPDESAQDAVTSLDEIHAGWLADWRFLTGSESLHSGDFDAAFPGMHLPRTVVDRIYRRNAEQTFPAGWRTR
jgi:predicted TIM-barrel fold metal-dependent hydrolase